MIGMLCYTSDMMTEKIMSRTINDDGCLLWQGSTSRGYGNMRNPGGSTLVHRIVWEEANGPIPAGLTIDHLCKRKNCVNVLHMEVVTNAENVRRSHPRPATLARTTCSKGHPFAHTVLNKGYRERRCRECHRDAQARYLARRAAS